MLKITEVATTCAVSRNTVGKWIRAGILDVVRIGAVVRVTRASFDALVAGSAKPPRSRIHG